MRAGAAARVTSSVLGPRSWALGCAVLTAEMGALFVGAVAVRRRLAPEWRGVLARLSEVVLMAAGLVVLAEVLGAFGWFRRWPMLVACVVAGAAATVSAGRRPPARVLRSPSLDLDTAIAVAVATFAVARWAAPAVAAMHTGPLESDTLTYHLPHAVRFVQDGWLTRLPFVTVDDAIPYHPQNGELFHAIGMLALRRDVLSPLINAVWLAATLAAAWAIGRRRHAGAVTVAATAALTASPLMTQSQAGAATTDIVATFFLLATVAFVLEARERQGPIVVAGLACGLAAGSKLSVLVPVAIIAVGCVAAAPSLGHRRSRFALLFVPPMAVTGVFWYARNLARTGNPVPAVGGRLGPLELYRPPMRLIDTYGFKVADYVLDAKVWRGYFLPGLSRGLGRAWPVVIVAAMVAAVIAVVRSGSPAARVTGIAAIVSAAVYVVTPTTALGYPHKPTLFVGNLRYLTPALALGLVLVADAARHRALRATAVGAFMVALGFDAAGEWPGRPLAAVAVGSLVGAASLAFAYTTVSRRAFAGVVAGAVLVAAGLGYPAQHGYLDARYRSAAYRSGAPDRPVFAWAQGVRNARIGMAGFFLNYPLYGADLSNRVRYVGDHRADGSFTDFTTCGDWRRAVDGGGFDYVVTMPAFPSRPGPEPPMARWTRTDRHARQIYRNGTISVFRLTGALDADGCAVGR